MNRNVELVKTEQGGFSNPFDKMPSIGAVQKVWSDEARAASAAARASDYAHSRSERANGLSDVANRPDVQPRGAGLMSHADAAMAHRDAGIAHGVAARSYDKSIAPVLLRGDDKAVTEIRAKVAEHEGLRGEHFRQEAMHRDAGRAYVRGKSAGNDRVLCLNTPEGEILFKAFGFACGKSTSNQSRSELPKSLR